MKFFVVFLLLGGGVGFFLFNLSVGVFDDLIFLGRQTPQFFPQETSGQIVSDLSLKEPKKEVSTPPPVGGLRIFQPSAPSTPLSAEGVFQWTNEHRQEVGLDSLERNSLLDAIAASKVQDMFALQYFAHISPLDVGIGDVAQEMEYEFITIGENLALGNYAGDQALVQAWMDSPGHRANILGARYQEIGIALQRGVFEGSPTWIAVQVFGLPLSACDSPDEQLKEAIELEKTQIEEVVLLLDQMRAELEAYRPKVGPGYNRKVSEYNTLVEQYNTLAAGLKGKVGWYNMQVQLFNECAQS